MFDIKESLLAEDIPMEDYIRPQTILTKKGAVMAMYAMRGVFPGVADPRDVAIWFDRLHNTYRNIAAEDVEVVVYECRGEASRQNFPRTRHKSRFAQSLADAYEDNLFNLSLYSNPLYFGILIHPRPPTEQKARKVISGSLARDVADIQERADRLEDTCGLIEAQLALFKPTRLGQERRGYGLFDGISEAILFALTGNWRPIAVTTGRICDAIMSEEIDFSLKRLIAIDGPASISYAAMFAMKEYPVWSYPGMFGDIAVANYRSTMVHSYRFLSNAEAENAISKKQDQMVIASDKAFHQTAALSNASAELMDRRWALGDHSCVLIVFAATQAAMRAVANAAHRDLAAAGLTSVRMKKTLQAAFLSMFPGNEHWRPRPGLVKSTNFTAFAPFYNHPSGDDENKWGKPIAVFRTLAGTLVKFGYHVAGVGSTLVTGVPGAGKTFITSLLIAMTASRARIIGLDHKRGWKFLTEALNGDYGVLGVGEPNFAPLKVLTNSRRDLRFLNSLIRGCIGGTLTEEDGRRLALGLAAVMRMPPEMRSLGEVRAFFDNTPEGAGMRLNKWLHGNEMGWVIDAPRDTIAFSDMTVLDVTSLIDDDRARGPAMAYLFYRILGMLNGQPLLIPIDEGWKVLRDPFFAAMIENLIRIIRSKNGVLIFITQDPGDLITSGIANVLLTMCPTQFHMANPKGSRSDYIDGLKLTEGQYEAFRNILPGEGTFLLVQGREAVVAQAPLFGLTKFIPILSATEEDLVRADTRELEVEPA